MRNLIEQMLELARADNARGKELSGKVELGKLILNALLTFEPVFFERGRMLEQRVIEDIHVQGSAEQLRQIVDILLDNAQKYSRESGKTWVSLQKNGKKRMSSDRRKRRRAAFAAGSTGYFQAILSCR